MIKKPFDSKLDKTTFSFIQYKPTHFMVVGFFSDYPR